MTSWTEALLEVESYMERYRKALQQIVNTDWSEVDDSMSRISEIAQTALDGEPTTADKFNDRVTWVSPNDPGDENDLNKVQDHGPPYSMANPSGEPVKPHPLAARFNKKGIQDDPEC
jgi:hypothetical protein